jgi:hypothetical protein
MTRRPFDPQAFAADAQQRRWEHAGLSVTRARLADGTIRLSAPQRSVLVAHDGHVTVQQIPSTRDVE